MRINTKDLPLKIDIESASARQLEDFGTASGNLAAEHFRMAAGTDLAPLLEGLTEDACQSAHWGYILSGDVAVSYSDGTEEVCRAGELVHWPSGHTVRADSDAEFILFSPQADHVPVVEHIASQLAGA